MIEVGANPSSLFTRKLIALSALTLVLLGVGILLIALAFLHGWPWGAFLGGGIAVLGGLICLSGGLGMIRERRIAGASSRRPLQMVTVGRPLPAPTTRRDPWAWEDVVRAVAMAFADTPYLVMADQDQIRISANLADARWRHLLTERSLSTTFASTLVRTKPGTARRLDVVHEVEASAGPAGLGAVAALSSGRSWHFSRRKDWALNRYGFHTVVDYRFSTGDVNVPLDHVLKTAGWRQTLDAESKGALVMGILGLSAVPLVPLAFLVKWLVER
ncbi:hypothetical protein [Brachybacterium tyrofermentans]|uniref:Uncharacterized protein n=1 Tax=Brachybacterium tyrofermentans TaxID=47848 RepID=A0ABW0FLW7_9MICO|nr:hypothetical protein [Brachybacterium tyrofermentans]SLN01294.1 hypothetical protein FM103_09390 [Corynebacterium xerosis]